MANKDHVVWIEKGIKLWNAWRKENRDIQPDFIDADLHGADLCDADLSRADLRGANLQKAKLNRAELFGANLIGSDLTGAKLIDANLTGAKLVGADLSDSDLQGADFTGVELSGVRFVFSNLERANFDAADLSNASLIATNLYGAKLDRAQLRGANFSVAILQGADLQGADLSGADLRGADLRGADLRSANLQGASLIDSRLDGANLTSAKLWETQRGGWSIKGIICEQAFWDKEGEKPTKYLDGDFEHIYAEKPRIVLRYAGGISPVDLAMLPLIVERLQAEHPDSSLHIRSVQDDGGGATVTITVEDLAGRSDEAFAQDVDSMRADLVTVQQRLQQEERLRLEFEIKYSAVVRDILPMMMERALPKTENHIGQITGPTIIEGAAMNRDTYNTGQAGAVGPNAHAHDMTFQQVQNQTPLDLPRLAEELARLRADMKKAEGKDEQDEAIGAVAAAEKAAARGDGATALRHLKTAGQWTLGVAEKIGVAVAVEAIKRAM